MVRPRKQCLAQLPDCLQLGPAGRRRAGSAWAGSTRSLSVGLGDAGVLLMMVMGVRVYVLGYDVLKSS
jgi:hypothetical protein